jgi:hypothetical protein
VLQDAAQRLMGFFFHLCTTTLLPKLRPLAAPKTCFSVLLVTRLKIAYTPQVMWGSLAFNHVAFCFHSHNLLATSTKLRGVWGCIFFIIIGGLEEMSSFASVTFRPFRFVLARNKLREGAFRS